jgi:hypothetical protein
MLAKTLCRLVLGVNHQGKHAEIRPRRARQRIGQKDATETMTLVRTGHGKPSQQHRGDHRIAGQLLCDRRRQRIQRHAGGRKRVVTSHLLGRNAHGHKTRRDAPLDILRCLFAEIPVERIRAANRSSSRLRLKST